MLTSPIVYEHLKSFTHYGPARVRPATMTKNQWKHQKQQAKRERAEAQTESGATVQTAEPTDRDCQRQYLEADHCPVEVDKNKFATAAMDPLYGANSSKESPMEKYRTVSDCTQIDIDSKIRNLVGQAERVRENLRQINKLSHSINGEQNHKVRNMTTVRDHRNGI